MFIYVCIYLFVYPLFFYSYSRPTVLVSIDAGSWRMCEWGANTRSWTGTPICSLNGIVFVHCSTYAIPIERLIGANMAVGMCTTSQQTQHTVPVKWHISRISADAVKKNHTRKYPIWNSHVFPYMANSSIRITNPYFHLDAQLATKVES